MNATFENTESLRKLLLAGGRYDLAKQTRFEVDLEVYKKFMDEFHKFHPHVPESQHHAHCLYRTLTHNNPLPARMSYQHEHIHEPSLRAWIAIITFLIILLLLAIPKMHGQQSTTIRGAAVGTATPLTATVHSVDANTKGVDVICSGCSAASSVAINDGAITSRKATVTAGGDIGVQCNVGCAGSSFLDKAAFTFGTTSITVGGGVFDDTPPAALTTGMGAAFRVTPNRAIHFNIRNQAGTEMGTVSNPFQVTGANGTFPVTGTFFQSTQPVSVVDGLDVTLGAKADPKSTATDTTAISIVAILKEISAMEQAPASRTVTNAGTFAVQAALNAETTKIIGETIPVATATTTDALSECTIVSAASTNSTLCKNASGNMYGLELYNTTTTVYYLRLYNQSSAPTCSSSTGFIRSIPVPPAAAAGGTGGAISNFGFPVGYGTGIGYCLTGGSSSTDNTNAAVGIFGALRYK